MVIRDGTTVQDWGTITVADALADRQRMSRCLACSASVRPHKASADQEAHFEHRREFAGCPSSAAGDGRMRPPRRRTIGFLTSEVFRFTLYSC